MLVLAQMAAATGWSPFTLPSDAVVIGTVTRYPGDTSDTANITLKVRGFRQSRSEVRGGASSTTTIRNGDRAVVQTFEGTRWLPGHSASAMLPMALPFLSDLTASADPSVTVNYLGADSARGEAAHRVEIIREPATDDPLGD